MKATADIFTNTALEKATGLINKRFPEALIDTKRQENLLFSTGLKSFDALFPSSGIPYGQLIEITGDLASGKTSLLLHIMAGLMKRREQAKIAYVDTAHMFFPGAAVSCGVDLGRLIVVKPQNLQAAARTTELLLRHRLVGCVVCDLAGQKSEQLDIAWCHRLRTRTVRAKGLVVFLTENSSGGVISSGIIPPSMISLRIEVIRKDVNAVWATVTKSRISPEGARAEVIFDER